MSKTYTLILFLFVFAALAVSIGIIQNRDHQLAMKQKVTSAPSQRMSSPTPTINPMATDVPVEQIPLTISSPQDGLTVSTSTVTVAGKTVPDADVIIDDTETSADAKGNFVAQLTLDEGDNPIVVVANDANGNYSEKDLTVTYTPQVNQ